MCISKKFRRSLQDVRAKRGADVVSDHHLVVARFRLKQERNWTGVSCQHRRFNTALLKDADKLQEYRFALSNRFQVFQEHLEEETIDEQWKEVRKEVTATCNGILGFKKHSHKEWISPETLKKVKDRNQRKVAFNNSRTRTEKGGSS